MYESYLSTSYLRARKVSNRKSEYKGAEAVILYLLLYRNNYKLQY